MTEKEFWRFLEKAREKGRALQASGSIDSPDPVIQAAGEYIGDGHALLPADYQNMPKSLVRGMGKLLFKRKARTKTKEAILVLLAHQCSKDALNILREYNKKPDKALRYFARFALDECEMWNE